MVELKKRYPCQQAMLERAEITRDVLGDVIDHNSILVQIRRRHYLKDYDTVFGKTRHFDMNYIQAKVLRDICENCRYKDTVEEEGYEWLM